MYTLHERSFDTQYYCYSCNNDSSWNGGTMTAGGAGLCVAVLLIICCCRWACYSNRRQQQGQIVVVRSSGSTPLRTGNNSPSRYGSVNRGSPTRAVNSPVRRPSSPVRSAAGTANYSPMNHHAPPHSSIVRNGRTDLPPQYSPCMHHQAPGYVPPSNAVMGVPVDSRAQPAPPLYGGEQPPSYGAAVQQLGYKDQKYV